MSVIFKVKKYQGEKMFSETFCLLKLKSSFKVKEILQKQNGKQSKCKVLSTGD